MGLLAAYNFDEASGNVLDLSGNSRDFGLGVSATRTTGKNNSGATTTASGTPAVISSTSPFGQTADRSFSCWVKSDATPNTAWIIEWYNTADDTGTWGLLCLSGSMGARVRNASAAFFASVAGSSDAAWHHWAGTFNGTSKVVSTYRDGVSVATATLTGTARTDANALRILDFVDETGWVLDDLRIYDHVLTLTEVQSDRDNAVAVSNPQPILWDSGVPIALEGGGRLLWG